MPLVGRRYEVKYVCAVARESAGFVAIIPVPRLCSMLLSDRKDRPTVVEVWGDTRIELPPEIRKASYRNVFTGEGIVTAQNGDGPALALSSLLANFPVGLVYSE